MVLTTIIVFAVALVVGGLAGYAIFRYVIKGKYNEMVSAAEKKLKLLRRKNFLK